MERGEISGFVIQRDDTAWYAGPAEDGSKRWPKERDQRHVFTSGKEAMEMLERLQQSGHQVRLFALI
jgi:hypothetical protein